MTGFDEPPVAFSRQPALTPETLSLAIQARRSIRQFKTREIPAETIRRIIEAGRFSPTAKNAQDVSYIVLRDKIAHFEKIAVGLFRLIRPVVALFWNVAGQIQIDEHFFFKKAPIAIMVLSKNKVNGTLAAANMALVAESCGLGVLYSGYFTLAANYSRALRQALCLHRKDKVVTTLVLGYPSVHYHRTAQRERANVRYL